MNSNTYILSYMIFLVIPMAQGSRPGTYFWRPRLGIDLAIPTTEPAPGTVHQPTKDNIREGKVVMVDGYQMGLTLLGIATGMSAMKPYPHLNPGTAYYYTNVYRWALRYLSLIPFWAGGNGGHITQTHRTWRRRFYYMDEMVPEWLKYLVPYVPKKSWDQHDLDHRRFKAHSESAFGKHYRYPSRTFRNFASFQTTETMEVMDSMDSKESP